MADNNSVIQNPPSSSVSIRKPRIIGLFGVPGSGRSSLLESLKSELDNEKFSFFDSFELLSNIIGQDGLEAVKEMDEETRRTYREQVIMKVREDCASTSQIGLVTSQYSVQGQPGNGHHIKPILALGELQTYTHVLYLDPAPQAGQSTLSPFDAHLLREWHSFDKWVLRDQCAENGIFFRHVPSLPDLERVKTYIQEFVLHTEEVNLERAQQCLEEILGPSHDQLSTVLIMDGDGTLSAEDTGPLFFKGYSTYNAQQARLAKAKYSYDAFRQVVIMCEEELSSATYETLCNKAAVQAEIRPEFSSLLHVVAKQKFAKAIIVTSSHRLVWEKIIEREGLSRSVQVIGGGRLSDGFVVTPEVKEFLVTRLRHHYLVTTWVFGDDLLDLGMLIAADHAIVVVGKKDARSQSMERELDKAIKQKQLQARQVLFPNSVTPRLDTDTLPVVQITSPGLIDQILGSNLERVPPTIILGNFSNAARLLMTPMRDATLSGPDLREAHQRVGRYLTTQYLGSIVTLSGYPLAHIDGYSTNGYRFFREDQMTIIAMMRGGEPMAFGVSAAAPTARFMHAHKPQDITSEDMVGQTTLVLVDSIIDSENTVMNFVRHVRGIHATIRIVLVTDLVHTDFIETLKLNEFANVSLIALRSSEYEWVGIGATSVGNRLFNTTHLDRDDDVDLDRPRRGWNGRMLWS